MTKRTRKRSSTRVNRLHRRATQLELAGREGEARTLWQRADRTTKQIERVAA